MANLPTRCGSIAIVGRPNVGKSTFLNTLLGQKISITSRKPQTTRHQILGIKTQGATQAIFMDTPGLHSRKTRALNQYMNRVANNAIMSVDLVVFLIDARGWHAEDKKIAKLLRGTKNIVIVVLNKIDKIENREQLLPLIEFISETLDAQEIIPMNALESTSVAIVEKIITRYLPVADWIFPEDQITDRSTRFIAAELIREQYVKRLGEELPYRLSVEVEHFESSPVLVQIGAIVWVEKQSHKGIAVGKNGRTIKSVGIAARHELETMLEGAVNLKLWVKVKKGWSDDTRALLELGYD